MTMTRQHFEAIAQTIRELPIYGDRDQEYKVLVVDKFVDMLRTTNPNFDAVKFKLYALEVTNHA